MKQQLFSQILRYGWVLFFLTIFQQLSLCQAQTISQQEIQGTTALVNGGQSFTATINGTVTTIRVLVAKAATGRTLQFFKAATVTENGVLNDALYTSTDLDLTEGWNNITLETPFTVAKGEQYVFTLSGTVVYNGNFSDTYKSGEALNNKILTASRTDLVFEIFEEK